MLLEEILENPLEDMNKQPMVHIPLMILCILKLKELKKMLKEQLLFFVLQLLKIVLLTKTTISTLNFSILKHYSSEVQFSVSGSGFSVLIPASDKFNFLYRASDSLKN